MTASGGYPESRAFAEPLIDWEEDGMLPRGAGRHAAGAWRMTEGRSPPDRSNANERQRMKYAKQASSYDKESDFDKRWLYGTQHRTWACFRATGTTLEVAIGTGLNLPLYPPEVRLVGLDLTPEMADGAALTPRVGANGYLCRPPLRLSTMVKRSFSVTICSISRITCSPTTPSY